MDINKQWEEILKEKAELDYKIKFVDELYDNGFITMNKRVQIYKYYSKI